ncbi:MAG: hypothetical protein ABL998_04965 [Planctomycetota bacterium]
MILENGSKVFISHRRLFEGDHARYFVGIVEAYENGIARVCGHTWTRDGYQGQYRRKDDERTKIIALTSGAVMLYALPSHVDLASARMTSEGGELFLSDARGWRMDLSEGLLHAAGPLPGRRQSEHRAS